MTNNFESVGTVNLQSDIIEIIPITTNINSYILYNPSNLNYNRINSNVISNLSIYIYIYILATMSQYMVIVFHYY
jgi:hypothetical protein